MEITTKEDLKAYLMRSNEQFRNLAEQHLKYKQLIEAIEAKPHVTPEDEIEEHRLKKLKLALKDQMQAMVERHRAEHAA